MYYYHTIDTYTGLLVPACVLLSYDRYLYWTISPRGYHPLLSYDRYLYWTISPRVYITIIRSIPILDYQSPSVYYYHTIDTYTGLLVPECVLLSYDRYLYWTISPRVCITIIRSIPILDYQSPRVSFTIIIRSIPILDYQSPRVSFTTIIRSIPMLDYQSQRVSSTTIIRSIPILDYQSPRESSTNIIRSIPILDYQSPSVYYYHTIDTYTGLLVPECVLLSYDRYLYWTISPRVCITIIRSIPILDYQSPRVSFTTIIRSIPILDYQSLGVYYYHTIDTYTGLLVPECVLLSYDRYLYWTISPRVCITIIRPIPILDYQSPSVYYYHTIDTYTGLLVPECVLLSYDRYLYWTISPRVCITIIRSIPILDYQFPKVSSTTIIQSIPILDYQSPSVYYYHTIDTYTGLLVTEYVLLSYDRYLYWTISPRVYHSLLSYDRYLYWTISPRVCITIIRSIPILDYQSPRVSFTTIIRSIPILDYQSPSVYYYHTIDTYTGLLVPECVLLSYDRYLYWTISPRVCITIIRSIPILDYQSPSVYYYHTIDTYTGLLVPEGIIHYYHTIDAYTGLLVPECIIHYYHTIDTYTGLLVPECVLLSYDRYLYWTISPRVCITIIRSIPILDYQSPRVSFTTIIRSIPILDYQSPSVYYYHTIDTYTGLLVHECVLLSYDRYLYWTISPRWYYSHSGQNFVTDMVYQIYCCLTFTIPT